MLNVTVCTGTISEDSWYRGSAPGILSSPLVSPACSITCKALTMCCNPIPSTCLPSLGTTSVVQSCAVTTLMSSPEPVGLSKGGAVTSSPGDSVGMSKGDEEK